MADAFSRPARRRAHARRRQRQADPFPAMPAQENPALGLRGIRASLWRPELLRADHARSCRVRPANRAASCCPWSTTAADIEAVRAMIRRGRARRGRECRHSRRHHDRDAGPALAAGPPGSAGRFLLDRHQRPHAIRARDRPHAPAARRWPRRAASGRAAADRARRATARAGAARRRGLRRARVGPAAAPLLVGSRRREFSAVPGAIPAIKDAVRRRASPNAAISPRAHSRSKAPPRSVRCLPQTTRGTVMNTVRVHAAVRARADAAHCCAAGRGPAAAARPAGPARHAAVAAAGEAIFSNLGLLFAIGIAVGMARENHGAAGLAAVVGYLVATQGRGDACQSLRPGPMVKLSVDRAELQAERAGGAVAAVSAGL